MLNKYHLPNSVNDPIISYYLVTVGGGMKGGAKVIIEAHRHEGVFIARSKEDALVTLNRYCSYFHYYYYYYYYCYYYYYSTIITIIPTKEAILNSYCPGSFLRLILPLSALSHIHLHFLTSLVFYLPCSTPGKDVYGEKRIQVEGPPGPDGNPMKLEYRVWNPFRR